MAIVGVIYFTSIVVPPASAQSPATTILSHLSDLYPAQTQSPFHIDHRLFVSTSSLLPQGDNKRTFTHFFTSSRSPQKTYVGTTAAPLTPAEPGAVSTGGRDSGLSIITIPTSASLEPFLALLNQKLQPQWASRQSLAMENGATFSLPITDNTKWRVSVGDMRVSPSRASGPAAGQLRGVVLEILYEDDTEPTDDTLSDEEEKRYDTLFRGLLRGLFKKMPLDLGLSDVKIHLIRTLAATIAQGDQTNREKQVGLQSEKVQRSSSNKPSGHEIAELYMEILRGPRG